MASIIIFVSCGFTFSIFQLYNEPETSILLLSYGLIYSDFVKQQDTSEIVIDEFLGITFILIFYDFVKFTNDILMFFLIFILFRLFDIIKFFPANWIHKNLKNSLGVILDDIVAGSYCVIILYIFNVFS